MHLGKTSKLSLLNQPCRFAHYGHNFPLIMFLAGLSSTFLVDVAGLLFCVSPGLFDLSILHRLLNIG